MAHFAKLNTQNKVIAVEVVHNDVATDEDAGIAFLEELHGQEDGITWKMTSYNTWGNTHLSGGTPFRKNFAAVGGFYDEDADGFYQPSPYNSWTLNSTTFIWEAPVAYPTPTGDEVYEWNEQTQTWDEVVES